MRAQRTLKRPLTVFSFILSLIVLTATIYIGGGSISLAVGMGIMFTLPITMLTAVAEGLLRSKEKSDDLKAAGFVAMGDLFFNPVNRDVLILADSGDRLDFHMDVVSAWRHKQSEKGHFIEFELNDDYRTYTIDAMIDSEADVRQFRKLVDQD